MPPSAKPTASHHVTGALRQREPAAPGRRSVEAAGWEVLSSPSQSTYELRDGMLQEAPPRP